MTMTAKQKPSKIDKALKLGVLLNVITVPLWIIFHRPDMALLDIGSGALIEEGRKKINKIRGRNRIQTSRLALAT